MIRAVILAATAAALICLWLDRPVPVQSVEVKYCIQWQWRWGEFEGKTVRIWYRGYNLCSERDQYEWA